MSDDQWSECRIQVLRDLDRHEQAIMSLNDLVAASNREIVAMLSTMRRELVESTEVRVRTLEARIVGIELAMRVEIARLSTGSSLRATLIGALVALVAVAVPLGLMLLSGIVAR